MAEPATAEVRTLRRQSLATVMGSLCLLPALVAAPAAGEPDGRGELGRPFLRNYGHHEYAFHPQNWAVLQTSGGRMLFGNTDGVLEYDGVRWRSLTTANRSIVRSLAEASGTVYVGAIGELGYLERDPAGGLAYVSLTDFLPAEERDFADVWATWATDGEGVVYWTPGRLFCWRQDRFTVLDVESLSVPAVVGGRLFNNRPGAGLEVLRGDAFETVDGGEMLAAIGVFRMLPYADDTLLLVTREGDLHLFSSPSIGGNAGVSPRLGRFPTAVDEELRRHGPYGVATLPDGGFALGTRTGGVLVIDHGGGLRFHVDKSAGLYDNSVWAAAVDREGGLWLGLNRGLARLEVSSPFTSFDDRSGLDGTVEAVIRHAGALFVATGAGAYRLEGGRFRPIGGLGRPPCWSLLSARDRLLVGCNSGVYAVEGESGRRIRTAANVFALYAPPSRPDLVFAGEADGLAVLRFTDGEWVDGGRIDGTDGTVRSIAEDDSGRLWLGTQYHGVLRLDFEAGDVAAEIRRFGLEDGLPVREGVKIDRFAGGLIFGTDAGVYRFGDDGRFRPDATFAELAPGLGVLRMAPQGEDRLWISTVSGGGAVRLRRGSGGSWLVDEAIFRRLPGRIFYAFHSEPSGPTWLGGVEGLFRFDPAREARHDLGFAVTVTAVRGSERLPSAGGVSLPYAESSVEFRFAAHTFHDESATVYRYFLEGFDADWSPWSGDAKKEYTSLPDGRFRFRVRARNVYGVESEAAAWDLVIRPPWYRTWPAYLAYVAVAGLLVSGLVRWRSRHLEREKRALGREIKARTRALQESEAQLRLALEGARMAAWSWDLRTGELTSWTRMAAVLGLEPKQHGATGRDYRKLVHPDDAERFDRVIAAATEGHGGDYEVEHRVLRPDGSVGWIFAKGRVTCDEAGLPQTMSGVIYDVSERKQAEAEHDRLFAELEATNDELERFTYTVSHDLKSPLVTVAGFLGLLQRDLAAGAGDRVRQDVERISSAVGKMSRMLDELLDLSRVGRVTGPSEPVPVAELVAEAAELVAVTDQGVELVVAAELPVVRGDRVRLVQVFQNLLDNATRFMGEQQQPRVEIDARPQDGQVVCRVADNGVGIEPQHRDRIFELFERFDSSVEGTGVGLALVKRIVEHHGGRIWVESEGRGHGSTFYFTLPEGRP